MAERLERLQSMWTTVCGLPMYARVSANQVATDNQPVVLVHGLVVSSRYMVPTATRLAPYCRVYAPDLPGFGKSGKPDHVLNLAELSDALAKWMRAAGLERAALLGNSFGCQIVVEFAIRHPELVTRSVLVGPTTDPERRTFIQQIARWLLNSTREPFSLIPILARDYLNAGLHRAIRTFQYSLQDPIEEKLPLVQVPTLVVRGAKDPIVPQRWAEEATKLLPMGRLVVIPGAAHTINYSAPLELVRVVRPFLFHDQQRQIGRKVA